VKHHLEISQDHVLLVDCAAALVVLVQACGWTWPLEAAAMAIAALLIAE
jgi:hypothetical protein